MAAGDDIVIGNTSSDSMVYLSNIGSRTAYDQDEPASDYWLIETNGNAYFNRVTCSRFYLSSTRYLHLSGNVLMYYDGMTDRTISVS
jgi:hypothetical protein